MKKNKEILKQMELDKKNQLHRKKILKNFYTTVLILSLTGLLIYGIKWLTTDFSLSEPTNWAKNSEYKVIAVVDPVVVANDSIPHYLVVTAIPISPVSEWSIAIYENRTFINGASKSSSPESMKSYNSVFELNKMRVGPHTFEIQFSGDGTKSTLSIQFNVTIDIRKNITSYPHVEAPSYLNISRSNSINSSILLSFVLSETPFQEYVGYDYSWNATYSNSTMIGGVLRFASTKEHIKYFFIETNQWDLGDIFVKYRLVVTFSETETKEVSGQVLVHICE